MPRSVLPTEREKRPPPKRVYILHTSPLRPLSRRRRAYLIPHGIIPRRDPGTSSQRTGRSGLRREGQPYTIHPLCASSAHYAPHTRLHNISGLSFNAEFVSLTSVSIVSLLLRSTTVQAIYCIVSLSNKVFSPFTSCIVLVLFLYHTCIIYLVLFTHTRQCHMGRVPCIHPSHEVYYTSNS